MSNISIDPKRANQKFMFVCVCVFYEYFKAILYFVA